MRSGKRVRIVIVPSPLSPETTHLTALMGFRLGKSTAGRNTTSVCTDTFTTRPSYLSAKPQWAVGTSAVDFAANRHDPLRIAIKKEMLLLRSSQAKTLVLDAYSSADAAFVPLRTNQVIRVQPGTRTIVRATKGVCSPSQKNRGGDLLEGPP